MITSCTSSGKPKDFDYGHAQNNKYLNSFFGLEVSLPEDWVVQSKEQFEDIAKLGKDIAVGDDENLKAVVEASEVNSANLLAVFKYEMGAPVDYNPSFMLVAENLKNAPGVKNGGDYLFQTRKLLKLSQIQYDHIDEAFTREMINNQEFYHMNCTINYMGFIIHQKYYSTIQNGFCLSAIISFVDEEQRNDLEQVVNAMVFSN
ncbi:hypothetical protein JCM15548_11864 [Geofilum rubicundum JCM 15548]|uniref:Uncharacterized protein n=2 Tax=Geofilum TaxID=1236988 RepID=A0A0E9LVP2_9BACT|nr:hypothetical protein JCM15548_11864 [Geofilum rubicundum JCM 15548]